MVKLKKYELYIIINTIMIIKHRKNVYMIATNRGIAGTCGTAGNMVQLYSTYDTFGTACTCS